MIIGLTWALAVAQAASAGVVLNRNDAATTIYVKLESKDAANLEPGEQVLVQIAHQSILGKVIRREDQVVAVSFTNGAQPTLKPGASVILKRAAKPAQASEKKSLIVGAKAGFAWGTVLGFGAELMVHFNSQLMAGLSLTTASTSLSPGDLGVSDAATVSNIAQTMTAPLLLARYRIQSSVFAQGGVGRLDEVSSYTVMDQSKNAFVDHEVKFQSYAAILGVGQTFFIGRDLVVEVEWLSVILPLDTTGYRNRSGGNIGEEAFGWEYEVENRLSDKANAPVYQAVMLGVGANF